MTVFSVGFFFTWKWLRSSGKILREILTHYLKQYLSGPHYVIKSYPKVSFTHHFLNRVATECAAVKPELPFWCFVVKLFDQTLIRSDTVACVRLFRQEMPEMETDTSMNGF